jgi:hypothetical protein
MVTREHDNERLLDQKLVGEIARLRFRPKESDVELASPQTVREVGRILA